MEDEQKEQTHSAPTSLEKGGLGLQGERDFSGEKRQSRLLGSTAPQAAFSGHSEGVSWCATWRPTPTEWLEGEKMAGRLCCYRTRTGWFWALCACVTLIKCRFGQWRVLHGCPDAGGLCDWAGAFQNRWAAAPGGAVPVGLGFQLCLDVSSGWSCWKRGLSEGRAVLRGWEASRGHEE